MTPDEHRQRLVVSADYPIVAPEYVELRRDRAVEIGPGRKPGQTRGRRKKTQIYACRASPVVNWIKRGATMRTEFYFLVAMAAVLSASASAQTLVGHATAVDGDSLSAGGLSVRLFGIDAPEARQTCTRDGSQWMCGEEAARQLGSLIEGRQVRCRGKGTDAYGRTVAVCEASGVELNKTMVSLGWALAFRSYSPDYIADEATAKAAGLGIWNSTFQLPQDYRQATAPAPAPERTLTPQRFVRAQTAVAGPIGRCAIKGNRNRKGQWIYHVPGMPYYDATRAEEFFCSEAQAQAAGYRRAIAR